MVSHVRVLCGVSACTPTDPSLSEGALTGAAARPDSRALAVGSCRGRSAERWLRRSFWLTAVTAAVGEVSRSEQARSRGQPRRWGSAAAALELGCLVYVSMGDRYSGQSSCTPAQLTRQQARQTADDPRSERGLVDFRKKATCFHDYREILIQLSRYLNREQSKSNADPRVPAPKACTMRSPPLRFHHAVRWSAFGHDALTHRSAGA